MSNGSLKTSSFPSPRLEKLPRLAAVAGFGTFVAAGPVQADTLAAGALFGGPTQTEAICYVYNAGKTAVTLKGFRITDLDGVAQTIITGECMTFPFSLGAGKACGIAVAATTGAMNCRVGVTPSKTDVRGVFEIRATDATVLQNTPMR